MSVKMFDHQQKLYDETRDLPYYGLLWEMRCGKTLPLINTVVHNYTLGKIDAALVIAPSGVDLNWSRKQLAVHRPTDIVLEFSAGKYHKPSFKRLVDRCILDKTNMLWIVTNVEGITTDGFKSMLKNLLGLRKVFLIVDESDMLKGPKAKRAKFLHNQYDKFPFRRIASGTIAPQGPFDLWSQFYLLSPDILGYNFTSFKQRYGVFKRVRFGGPAFDQLVKYKDLDILQRKIAVHSSRLTQKEVGIEIPMEPETRYFTMSEKQQDAYDAMRDDMMVEIDKGNIISAQGALVWLLRLQQISRGYLPDLTTDTVHELGCGPSIEALIQTLSQVQGKSIVWCRFRHDVDEVMKALGSEPTAGHPYAVRHDGFLTREQRQANLELFLKDPLCRQLVGTPATGGVGIDLSVADTTIYYSHSYQLRERLQSIARMQGPMQVSKSLLLVDIVAANTKDEDILANLARKKDLMAEVSGDKLREMLEWLKK